MAGREDRRIQHSHRDKLEAERLIDTVIRWADSAPANLELFSLKLSDPSPGLVSLLEKIATELREQGEYEGVTTGDDSYVGRIKHIFRASGLKPSELARELNVPEGSIFRWQKTRETGGVAPGYKSLERLTALARELGIPGSLLDDSCCLPMTVEPIGKPGSEPERQPAWALSARSSGVLVTVSNVAIKLLKDRSPNPP